MNYDRYIPLINNYWFRGIPDFDRWFKKSKKYDKEIKTMFYGILKVAELELIEHWGSTKEGFMAYIILLDQFSRQIYRNSKKAYQNDSQSMIFMRTHIMKYIDELSAIELMFALMPFQHSEKLQDQYDGIQVLKQLIKCENNKSELAILQEAFKHQKGHYKVIKMFGRFPKRNKYISNRITTIREQEYIDSNPDVPY
tara:strand:+ start:941 stop:1531 length:591 start_codon:yes stop_codon:yes gene_type:complete